MGVVVLGVIVYVMFEFCFYYGKILFCVEVLIKVGVVCVVVVFKDNDLCVFGCGFKMFVDVGIEVIIGVLIDEVVWDLKGFFLKNDEGCLFVMFKFVMMLDGWIVMVIGESKWIIGFEVWCCVYV